MFEHMAKANAIERKREERNRKARLRRRRAKEERRRVVEPEWCSHCNGYGSSLKEEADRCSHCGGSGLASA